jgi:Skp family chaperone for outer membrane proteins
MLFAAAPIAFPQAAPERDPGRIATINLQQAILRTGEGQKAAARLQAQWAPEIAALGKREAEIKAESAALEQESKRRRGWWLWRRGMNPKQRVIEARKIAQKTKALQRSRDDDRASLENEGKRILNELGKKMRTVLEDYARDQQYSAIVEAGDPQSPVLVTLNDITGEIISMYDKAYPAQP